LIICNEWSIKAKEYEDIIYNGLFSFIDDLVEPPDNPKTICIADENAFLFMQDNALYYKADHALEFLYENHIPVMK
jgi:hypothetical protein